MTAGRTPRLHALDIMRGMAVAAMIVVNNPGNWNAVFAPLTQTVGHALAWGVALAGVAQFIWLAWACNNAGMGLSRNAQCPCGSGEKYKHCHGAAA